MEDKFGIIFEDVSRVLVVVAHPDDADVIFGGTIARLIDQGKLVRILVCTNGALGSKQNSISQEELARVREFEQKKSFIALGGNPENLYILSHLDATLSPYDQAFLEEVVFHFRDFQPDIVLTHDPVNIFNSRANRISVNHRDHRAVGEVVVDATMPLSRDISFFRNQIEKGLSPAIVKKLLIATFTDENSEQVDISSYIDKKRAALLIHQSQIPTDVVNTILEFGKVADSDSYVESFKFIQLSY